MHAKIQKWGNSLALRIPKSFAEETHLGTGSVVDVAVNNGRIIVDPTPQPRYSLDELLRGVTKKNRHAETDTGGAVGEEIW